jgi:cell division protein FtsB
VIATALTLDQKIRHLDSLVFEDEQSKWFVEIGNLDIEAKKALLEELKAQKVTLQQQIENLKEQAHA